MTVKRSNRLAATIADGEVERQWADGKHLPLPASEVDGRNGSVRFEERTGISEGRDNLVEADGYWRQRGGYDPCRRVRRCESSANLRPRLRPQNPVNIHLPGCLPIGQCSSEDCG